MKCKNCGADLQPVGRGYTHVNPLTNCLWPEAEAPDVISSTELQSLDKGESVVPDDYSI